jgi:hypothetical protein
MVELLPRDQEIVSSNPAHAGVRERNDSRGILTLGSFFYVEMSPPPPTPTPVNILRQGGVCDFSPVENRTRPLILQYHEEK